MQNKRPVSLTALLKNQLGKWPNPGGQSSKSCTYTVFLPQGAEIELIFTLRAAVSEIQADFQNCHFRA